MQLPSRIWSPRLAAGLLSVVVLLSAACGQAPAPLPAPPQRVGIELRNDAVIGTLYLPDAPGPHPGVVVIGGSEGGVGGSGRLAGALADAGFAALAVGYFGMDGLPEQLTSIPLERFNAAIAWFSTQPQVRGQVALMGASKGAEAALLVAARTPDLAAVVAATPTHVAWQGLDMGAWSDVPSWTRGGAAIPYVRYNSDGTFWPLVEMYSRSLRDQAAVTAARIPVADITAPLLLVSGEKDQMWPAYAMALDIVKNMRAARPDAVVEHLSYADAGHAVIGLPFDPESPNAQRLIALGGSLEGNLAARRDGWPKVIEFLRTHTRDAGPTSSTRASHAPRAP